MKSQPNPSLHFQVYLHYQRLHDMHGFVICGLSEKVLLQKKTNWIFAWYLKIKEKAFYVNIFLVNKR
jgi:hypothetical protein